MPAPDHAHLSRLGGLPQRTILVVGPHRSGTTLLHRMLASATDVDVVAYYDVVEFPRLLDHRLRGGRDEAVAAIEARLRPLGGVRGIDRLPVGPFEPEEYGGVLRRSCVGLDMCRPYSNIEFGPLRLLARKKAFLAPRARPLLLKNPIDAYDGILRLDAALPGSTLVHVHRHPLRTIDSSLRAWRHLLERPNPWFAGIDRGYRALMTRPETLADVRAACGTEAHLLALSDRVGAALEHALEVERALPAERLVHVRFEDLCASPDAELARVVDDLELVMLGPPSEVVEGVPRHPVDPLVERIFAESIERWRPYLRRHGYADLPED